MWLLCKIKKNAEGCTKCDAGAMYVQERSPRAGDLHSMVLVGGGYSNKREQGSLLRISTGLGRLEGFSHWKNSSQS